MTPLQVAILVSKYTKVRFSHIIEYHTRKANVALARQIWFYLVCTALDNDYAQTGRLCSTDRTNVKHACGRIEDRRDDLEFDNMMLSIEADIEFITNSRRKANDTRRNFR